MIHYPLFIIHYPLSIIYYPSSIIHYQYPYQIRPFWIIWDLFRPIGTIWLQLGAYQNILNHFKLFVAIEKIFNIHFPISNLHCAFLVIHCIFFLHFPFSLFIIHTSLSIIHYSLSLIHYPLSIIHYPLSVGSFEVIRCCSVLNEQMLSLPSDKVTVRDAIVTLHNMQCNYNL